MIIVLLGALDDDSDVDTELDSDLDLETNLDLNLEGDVDMGVDTDFDADFDVTTETAFDFTIDQDINGEFGSVVDTHIELNHGGDVGIAQDSHHVEKSNYMMGNIATFMLIWGQIGMLNSNNLQDIVFLYAFIGGYLASSIFAWLIANYAKTVIIPIKHVNRGDIGTVIYGISPDKIGIVHVQRKDGVVTSILAKGAFNHDYFDKGEKGYIWSKEGEFYTLTKGIKGQPSLYSANTIKKKKALDSETNVEIKYIKERNL